MSSIEDAVTPARATLAIGIICVPLLLFGVVLTIFGVKGLNWTRPRSSPRALETLRRFLVSAGAFHSVKQSSARVPMKLPYPTSDPMQSFVKVPVVQASLSAKGQQQGTSLLAEAFSVSWPDERRDPLRVVPDQWLTVDLIGFPAGTASAPIAVPRDVLADRVRLYFFGNAADGAPSTLERLFSPGGDAYR